MPARYFIEIARDAFSRGGAWAGVWQSEVALALLSGAPPPLDAMPEWMQSLTLVNPVRHFATIARAVMLKGAGVEILYPNLLALIGFAVLLVAVSAWRFRKQLG